MCLLVVFHRLRPGCPCVVAANRHEALERPAEPARLHEDAVTWLGPTDLQAGGTWIGINEFGVLAAITNGRGTGAVTSRVPSRGLLCRAALEQTSLALALRRVGELTRSARHQPFQLLLADRERCAVMSNTGAAPVRWLDPGAHVLTNRHEIDGWSPDRLQLLADVVRCASEDALLRSLAEFCASHDATGEPPFAPCQHRDGHGTRSSMLMVLGASADQPVRTVFADGPPCRVPHAELPAFFVTA
ncbi:MAG: NRDE family protein [Planctomycetota bacterium]